MRPARRPLRSRFATSTALTLALCLAGCARTYTYQGRGYGMTWSGISYHERVLSLLEDRYGIGVSNILCDRGHARRYVDWSSASSRREAYAEDVERGLVERFGPPPDASQPRAAQLAILEQRAAIVRAACAFTDAAASGAPCPGDNAQVLSFRGPPRSIVPARDLLEWDAWRVCDSADAALADLHRAAQTKF